MQYAEYWYKKINLLAKSCHFLIILGLSVKIGLSISLKLNFVAAFSLPLEKNSDWARSNRCNFCSDSAVHLSRSLLLVALFSRSRFPSASLIIIFPATLH